MASTIMTGTTATPLTGPDAKLLGQGAKRVDNRAATMAQQIERLLRRMARAAAEEETERLLRSVATRYSFGKADRMRDLERQLRAILQNNGRTAVTSAARRASRSKTAALTDYEMIAFMRAKEVKLQQILQSTREAVRDSVRQILLTGLEEDPRPSIGELARRIRTVYHGAPGVGGEVRDVVPAPLINSRVLPTQRVRLTGGGNLYAFSSERAALIARTEMVQAENLGIIAGYKASGVKRIRWLAYRDGRSGDRRHNEMHGVETPLGVPFVLPDGTRMMYPGDPSAPIKHVANCRCSTRAVVA